VSEMQHGRFEAHGQDPDHGEESNDVRRKSWRLLSEVVGEDQPQDEAKYLGADGSGGSNPPATANRIEGSLVDADKRVMSISHPSMIEAVNESLYGSEREYCGKCCERLHAFCSPTRRTSPPDQSPRRHQALPGKRTVLRRGVGEQGQSASAWRTTDERRPYQKNAMAPAQPMVPTNELKAIRPAINRSSGVTAFLL